MLALFDRDVKSCGEIRGAEDTRRELISSEVLEVNVFSGPWKLVVCRREARLRCGSLR